jgi:hypothetical protein
MESSTPARVLVVAHKTAATPALLDAVRERAARGPAEFTLLVPKSAHGLHKVVDPEDQETSEADQVLELALPLLEQAAGGHVEGMIGDPNPLDAVQDAVNLHGFDELIISTLPTRVSKWLKLDLPSSRSSARSSASGNSGSGGADTWSTASRPPPSTNARTSATSAARSRVPSRRASRYAASGSSIRTLVCRSDVTISSPFAA